jgi:electron transfer flavoprotein alpha subunit
MQNADMVVAINSDPEAPIFEIADIGLVGDVACIVKEIFGLLKP